MRIPKNDRNEFAKSLAYDCNNTKTTKLSCYALKYNTFCPFNDKMCKEITQDGNNIVAVFGCAGKRDKAKRSVLGRIAGEYCSKVIVTEEDPRNENAGEIAREIQSGIKDTENIYIADK